MSQVVTIDTDKLVALRVRENGIAVSLQLLSGTYDVKN